jgi:hypothetical protein
MGKILDYIKWRGDLGFSKDPFNDIDALILSLLSYLPLKDIVPEIGIHGEISLKETASQFLMKFPTDKTKPINSTASSAFDSEVAELLYTAADCSRFADVRLSKFDENTDFVVGRQFAAVTYTFQNAEFGKMVAFRGTDNSLIGWKEDFDLAYMAEIPAQESAYTYLERTIGYFSCKYIVCGHSKGGNLAVYAGTHLKPARQRKLVKIINFDGPGFDFSVTGRAPFSRFENKVINYIPEESLVGMLLETVGEKKVILSSARFMIQHDAFNWEMERSNFLPGNLSSSAILLDRTLKTWLKEISLSDREQFLAAFFDLLGASEGKVISYDPQDNMKEIKNILVKYSKLNKQTKDLLTHVFESLRAETTKTLSMTIKDLLPRPADGVKRLRQKE